MAPAARSRGVNRPIASPSCKPTASCAATDIPLQFSSSLVVETRGKLCGARDLSLCTTCMFGCGCASRVLEHACGEDELERHGARQVWRRLWSPSGRRFPPQDLVARGASLSVPGDGSAACYRSPRFSASFRRRNVSLTYFPFRRTWTLQEPYFGLVIVATRVH